MKAQLIRRMRDVAFKHSSQWPWHPGNRAELLVDGSCYFESMFSAIEQARQQVLLEFYQVSSGQVLDRLIELLSQARLRGVAVYFLLDDFGCRGLSAVDRQRLLQAGIFIAFYNPLQLRKLTRNFARDHRKMLVVDGVIAFVGGSGLSDEFIDTPQRRGWHEMMLKFSGPVVHDWECLFARVWNHSSDTALSIGAKCPPTETDGQALMKLSTCEGPRYQEIKFNFRRRINASQSRVWLVTAYFLPSWSIRRALMRAAARGVDVRLLLPGRHSDHLAIFYASQRYYHKLLRAGVQIFEYSPRFNHAKICLSDQWVSLGSCNLDHWNLRWNLDANQEVIDPVLTAQLVRQLEKDFMQSQRVTLEHWQARPLSLRISQFIRGYLCALLLRLF